MLQKVNTFEKAIQAKWI